MAASGALRTGNHILPAELVLIVFEYLADDRRTLCALAQTNHRLQQLAEERLYRTLDLISVNDLHAIIFALISRPERVRAVQTLRILYQYRPSSLDTSEQARTRFNACVARMVNLRTWCVESPYDNFHWDQDSSHGWVNGDMESFRLALETACSHGPPEAQRIEREHRLGQEAKRTVGLALLQDLTIHSHGVTADFWPLAGFHCLFRHPSLRSLHVSCITFPPGELPELAGHVGKSPLTRLVFDECELTPKSLLSVLRTPACLKHLTMGENVFNITRTRRPQPRLSREALATLEALSAVAHSLHSLVHLDPGWRLDLPSLTEPPPMPLAGPGMRAFTSLTHIECYESSFLHRAIIRNQGLAPPSLHSLRVRRHWEGPCNFWVKPPEMDCYLTLPSLHTLELMQASYLWHHSAEAEYMCLRSHLSNMHARAYRLFKTGANLKVLVEMHRDHQIIPPYLHGERLPITKCVYDASKVGFYRHVVNHVSPPDETYDEYNSPQVPRNLAEITAGLPQSDEPAPETDRLGLPDIQLITYHTHHIIDDLARKLVCQGSRRSILDDEELSSGDDEEFEFDVMDALEVEDLNEDEDMELELELEDEFGDEDEFQVYEHNGEYYIEVFDDEMDNQTEMGTEDEDDMEEVTTGAGATGGG